MYKEDKRKHYNALKEYNGQVYSGMKVGGTHSWDYKDGIWNELKVAPDEWKIEFVCNKTRRYEAPIGTGALKGTEYHWYILADQKVVKLDENKYSTELIGKKFKLGHKMPNWKKWNYLYKNQSYEDRLIESLSNKEYSYPQFNPSQFKYGMTLKEVKKVLGDQTAEADPNLEAIKGSKIYDFYDQVKIALKDGKLVYVKTLPAYNPVEYKGAE